MPGAVEKADSCMWIEASSSQLTPNVALRGRVDRIEAFHPAPSSDVGHRRRPRECEPPLRTLLLRGASGAPTIACAAPAPADALAAAARRQRAWPPRRAPAAGRRRGAAPDGARQHRDQHGQPERRDRAGEQPTRAVRRAAPAGCAVRSACGLAVCALDIASGHGSRDRDVCAAVGVMPSWECRRTRSSPCSALALAVRLRLARADGRAAAAAERRPAALPRARRSRRGVAPSALARPAPRLV